MTIEPESALISFGFNQLESIVYYELLRQSPATGYRLAQRVGRAPANIYQTLKALLQKGAVLIESDAADAVSYRPVPPEQLFASLRTGYLARADSALDVLSNVHQPPVQEFLAQLRTASQVIEQARSMLGRAKRTVLFDCMPELYDVLRADFNGARDRGVKVVGIAYRREDAGPIMPFKGEPVQAVGERWPGLGLILVTDAAEQLVAQISRDMTEALNAVYSDSAFQSAIMHGLLHADIRLVALRTELGAALPSSPLDAFSLRASEPPGLAALMRGEALVANEAV